MENYEIEKKLLKIKGPLELNYLEKYYQNTIKTKQTILDLKKINCEKNEYQKINWEIIISKKNDYQKENELKKLKDFYFKNKNHEIKNYDFLNLITDFKENWENYSKLTIDQQQLLFYKKIAKYKAYLESTSNNKQIIKNEFLNCFIHFKNINQIISKQKAKYQNQELKNYDELMNLIMLKKNNLLNSNDEIKKLQIFLTKTNFKKFYDKYEHKSEINWITKPIDSLTKDWEIETIKNYFIYVGTENFIKKEKFYHDISTNKSLIKEQLSLEFINIFYDIFKNDENYFDFLNITNNQIFKKIEMVIKNKIYNGQINSENLNYLLKSELYLLNNNNLENYQKLKNKIEKIQKKLNKKIKNDTLKSQEKSFSNLKDKYLDEIIENQNSLNRKINSLKIEKDNKRNQDNLFDNIKEINKYLTLLKSIVFFEKNEIEKKWKRNFEIDFNSEIDFNNEIIEKISKIDSMLNTIYLFEENIFFKKENILKETKICFKLLNEKIDDKLKVNNDFLLKKINNYKNENSNNDSLIPPNDNILDKVDIENFKKELEIINQLELIEKQELKLKNFKQKYEEKLKIIKIEENEAQDKAFSLKIEEINEEKAKKNGVISKGSKIIGNV